MTTPIGKYKLIKLIASGGMAEVYLAKQAGAAGFEKMVCLKRILPHLARDKQFVDMFLNEARLAAQLDHPNIVQIFDLGEANGNYFIAMEFIDGPNLRTVAKRALEMGELLPIAEVARIIAQAAGGLHYAHELADPNTGQVLGLVHRDISPDNILVHKNGSVKVVDFGIAKAAGSTGATRTGTLKGKVAYMPPEQLRGEPLDRRVDVFALGVVTYEMLGGHRPWEGNSEVALIGQIMTTDPQPLGELRPDAPPELLGIVERCLAKDREERYQSAHELQSDLESVMVQMGQSVTNARIAEFVRYYTPVEQDGSATTGIEEADLSSLGEQVFGSTGAAPALVGPAAQAPEVQPPPAHRESSGTLMMEEGPPPEPKRGAWKYAVAAFLLVALLGGGGFWAWKTQQEEAQVVVPVERVAVEKPPPPPPPPPEPKKEPPPPAEAPKPKPKKLARAPKKEPEPPKVEIKPPPPAPAVTVIVKEAEKPKPPPPPPPPVVTAKGELQFRVRPWAKVEVDGQEVGATPLDKPLMLPAGPHDIRLFNPDMNKEFKSRVIIPPNGIEILKHTFSE